MTKVRSATSTDLTLVLRAGAQVSDSATRLVGWSVPTAGATREPSRGFGGVARVQGIKWAVSDEKPLSDRLLDVLERVDLQRSGSWTIGADSGPVPRHGWMHCDPSTSASARFWKSGRDGRRRLTPRSTCGDPSDVGRARCCLISRLTRWPAIARGASPSSLLFL